MVVAVVFSLSADQPHICQRLDQFGHGKGTIYGGCSEYTIIPAKYAYVLNSDIDDNAAVLMERKWDYK